jgi:hypothetical protein
MPFTSGKASVPAGGGTPAWSQQGFFQFPGSTPATVNSMEEWWWDAWNGPVWSKFYPSSLASQPLSDKRTFVPVQSVANYIASSATQPSSPSYGDRFLVLAGSDDAIFPLYFSDYMNRTPNMTGLHTIDAENQMATAIGASHFYQVTDTPQNTNVFPATAGAIPWSQHHTFLGDDVSLWGPTGSNISPALTTLLQ